MCDISNNVATKNGVGISSIMAAQLRNLMGKTVAQAAQSLQEESGYIWVAESQGLLMSPDESHLFRLSHVPEVATAFAEACRCHENNPHLPRVFCHIKLSERSYLTMIEPLVPFHKFGKDELCTTMFGQARAFAAFLSGDEMHKAPHECMRHDAQLTEAAKIIVQTARQAKDHAKRVAIDTTPPSVMFRKTAEGECQAVYVAPLVLDGHHSIDKKTLAKIESRFSDNELRNPASPFWPQATLAH
ncbi:hypothetical protein [Micavibrio aeruginosavorus]|uniref:hypothetical protein n=1 Tax=Micavibrio aeruginosavorus TaxID=349221 RepID=UPI003F4AB064